MLFVHGASVFGRVLGRRATHVILPAARWSAVQVHELPKRQQTQLQPKKKTKQTENKSFQTERQWHAVYCGETFVKRGTKKSLSETHRPLGPFQRNLATWSQKPMPKSCCVSYTRQEGPQKKTKQTKNKTKNPHKKTTYIDWPPQELMSHYPMDASMWWPVLKNLDTPAA